MLNLLFGRPTRILAVAVGYDPDHGFLLTFNPRWRHYAFPMRKVTAEDDGLLAAGALDALREATELPLVGATARPLTYLTQEGVSSRTGAATVYRMHVYEIDTTMPLSSDVTVRGFGCRRGFLRPEAFKTCDLVSWNSRAILSDLLDNQDVAVAVVCRRGPAGAEFLMQRSPAYRGYFLPSSRIRTDVGPRFEAQQALQNDTGYRPHVNAGEAILVPVDQYSQRYDCRRRFNFHLVELAVGDRVNLNDPANDFELRLSQSALSGVPYRWVPVADLANPGANQLSPTIAALEPTLRAMAGRVGA